MKATIGRWIVFFLGCLSVLGILAMAMRDGRAPGKARTIENYKPWAKETLATAEMLPVQDGGRVKPLGTYAGFTMLRLHGARSMKIIGADGKKVRIEPLAWMMDCLFRPKLAVELPSFLVENAEVLEAAGIKSYGRRDRYSYTDLEPGLEKLMQLASSYEQISRQDPKRLRPVEQQTLSLAYNIRTFQGLVGYFGFARTGIRMDPLTGGDETRATDISTVMQTAPVIRDVLQKAQASGQGIPPHVEGLLQQVLDAANQSKYFLHLFPPGDRETVEWITAGDRIMNVMMATTREPERSVEDIKAIEEVVRALNESEAAFRDQLAAFESGIVARAKERGEYRSVPLEVDYFRTNWFIHALRFFLLAVLSAAVMWFTGRNAAGRISTWLTTGFLSAGLVCLIVPIVKRSIIMQRPPVGNLYDTIIFIAAAVVLLALVIEWMTRRRFVLGITPIVAAFLVVLARRFEVGEGTDHLTPLVAVLDSTYWLTTHVITITLGYAAGLVSAFLSIVYVLLRSLGLDGGDASLRRAVTRAVYGCICLTLFLSLVGTVLGGIWANDSWGRFWGWDPKENGALMIVLWTLAILHARLGGYIREWGLHLASIFGAMIVGFSWWHVNFLNVGLHNYGFAAEKKWAVMMFYGVMGCFILWGVVAWFIERQGQRDRRTMDEARRLAAQSP